MAFPWRIGQQLLLDAYCLDSVHRWFSWASDWLERQIKN